MPPQLHPSPPAKTLSSHKITTSPLREKKTRGEGKQRETLLQLGSLQTLCLWWSVGECRVKLRGKSGCTVLAFMSLSLTQRTCHSGAHHSPARYYNVKELVFRCAGFLIARGAREASARRSRSMECPHWNTPPSYPEHTESSQHSSGKTDVKQLVATNKPEKKYLTAPVKPVLLLTIRANSYLSSSHVVVTRKSSVCYSSSGC